LTSELSSAYNSQRFHLSSAKEKDMYMNGVMKKVERMGSYRLANQDADSPIERSCKEIENIIAKMQYSPSMNKQRAIWSPKKSKFPFYLTE